MMRIWFNIFYASLISLFLLSCSFIGKKKEKIKVKEPQIAYLLTNKLEFQRTSKVKKLDYKILEGAATFFEEQGEQNIHFEICEKEISEICYQGIKLIKQLKINNSEFPLIPSTPIRCMPLIFLNLNYSLTPAVVNLLERSTEESNLNFKAKQSIDNDKTLCWTLGKYSFVWTMSL